MAWVESVSPSFRARHESEDRDEVERVIEDLERLRDRLGRVMPGTPGDVEIVFHATPVALDVASPLLPLARRLDAPAPPPPRARPPRGGCPPLPRRRGARQPDRRAVPAGHGRPGLRLARLPAHARP